MDRSWWLPLRTLLADRFVLACSLVVFAAQGMKTTVEAGRLAGCTLPEFRGTRREEFDQNRHATFVRATFDAKAKCFTCTRPTSSTTGYFASVPVESSRRERDGSLNFLRVHGDHFRPLQHLAWVRASSI